MWNTRWRTDITATRPWRLILAAWLAVLAMPGVVQAQADTIRVALAGDMRSSWPGVRRDSNSDDILQHVVESLVAHRGDFSVAPMAASSYEVSDDLRTYRFTLRDGLRFHNLEPVRAEHLVMNWRKILEPAAGFQCLPFYDGTIGARVTSVEAEDARTLKIELDRPNTAFLEMLASVQCAVAILHPDSWDEQGRWIRPIGTGPFRLERWEKGRYVLLKKFEHYRPRQEPASGFAGLKFACVDSIRWISITDLIAANAAVVSGQIDLNYGVGIRPGDETRAVHRQPGTGRQVILIQKNSPLFGDVRMRRALAHALDLELFAATATFGISGANPSVVPHGSSAYSDVHRRWPAYDPARTKALLEEAGYERQEIVIRTTHSSQLLYDSAMIAQAMLQEAGFNARVELMEWSALIAAYFENDYDLMTFEYSPRLTPFMAYSAIVGSGDEESYLWNDAVASRLLRQASLEPDVQRRHEIYEDIHHRMAKQIPAINLFNIPVIDITSDRLRGYRAWSGSTPRLWNVCLDAGT